MENDILRSIILGVVQGITEFFPISSTAHLIIIPWFFSWHGTVNTLNFDIALHAGTLLALLIYFFKDWLYIITKNQRLLLLIVIATIPGAAAGFFLEEIVEKTLRDPMVIVLSLVIIGIYMLISERFATQKIGLENKGEESYSDNTQHNLQELTVLKVLLIGIAQAVALIPGVSRSGITIATGLISGLKREAAARFSFLMATPIIGGATLLKSKTILLGDNLLINEELLLFGAGISVSFLSGIVAIKFLMFFFRKFSLNLFVYYRVILAGIIVLNLWSKG